MITFGRLERIGDIRNHWPNEAKDFTPWLARPENIGILSEAVGLDLEVQSTEEAVGPFKADIVCRLASNPDHVVLIENQIERTDHTHLGQLITYAAGLDAVTIIWVARAFAEEHRAALDWLNRHTDEHLRFHGVEVELWRIRDPADVTSPPAPRFSVVSRPNETTKQARIAIDSSVTDGQRSQVAYWDALRAYGTARDRSLVPGASPKQNWYSFSLGRPGVSLTLVASRSGLQPTDHLRVELLFSGENAKAYFEQIRARTSEIESALGESLTWYEFEAGMQRRAYVWRAAEILNKQDWEGQFQWLFDMADRFDRVFRPIVRDLIAPPAGTF